MEFLRVKMILAQIFQMGEKFLEFLQLRTFEYVFNWDTYISLLEWIKNVLWDLAIFISFLCLGWAYKDTRLGACFFDNLS